MNLPTLPIPPLPPAWPYPPRLEPDAWDRQDGVDLGALGGDWTLTLLRDARLEAEASELEGALGRGGVHRRGGIVLRPYRRGGLVRHLVSSLYLSPRRFEREWLVHRALRAAGFPTVRPVGYAVRRRVLGFEGVCLTGFAEGRPWPWDWEAGQARGAELATAVRALCAWGLWAPDLNAGNILVTAGGLLLLDWDRAAFVAGLDLLPLYRRRLQRSLERLAAPPGIAGELAERLT